MRPSQASRQQPWTLEGLMLLACFNAGCDRDDLR